MASAYSKNGFTLIEVIVSLGLLVLIFGGLISLVIITREAERSSKNSLIASYLAFEGQELIRYRRDKNYIDSLSPFNAIATEINNTEKYILIDYTNTITEASSADVKQVATLEINNTPVQNEDYFYGYGLGSPTIFRRLITTTYHSAAGLLPAYIDVKVEVYWQEDTKSDVYILTSQLTDWQ